ncbi:hypothetical protein CIW49_31480 [Mycolicibacterium sp. P1-18]|uniref:hypothetical protein n=1 Tax=Mycolicibacterium sp. P1-18 TaxID=2024615 RepID=UPI0011F326F8|nr:hypothetical protein [Mycolicibacterium sp. P1-18]KAA0090911.1 hypothetical protein CIW49_31480 [Mycolicibacterium sp. P1-18]
MSNGFIADRFAHDIVTFMRNWAPYGGPPADEVLPEFGLTREQLVTRYQEIMAAAAARRASASRPAPGGFARPTRRPAAG